MPYKDKEKARKNNMEKQYRFKARQKAIALVQSGDPDKIGAGLNDYLFSLGMHINKGDAAMMWRNFMKYKEVCGITQEPMLPMTACMVMGLSVAEVQAILNRQIYKDNKDVQEVVNKVVSFVMADVEQAYLNKEIDKTAMIWYQKNFANMTDFPEAAAVEKLDDEAMTPAEIADKYKGILD